jgi:nicotinamidase-related amidase
VAAAQNPVLLELVERLVEMMRQATWRELKHRTLDRPGNAQRYLDQHRGVLLAIERYDAKCARQRMFEHLWSRGAVVPSRESDAAGPSPAAAPLSAGDAAPTAAPPAQTEAGPASARASLALPGRYYRLYPAAAPLGQAVETLELDLAETVMLLVDVYGRHYDEGFVPPPDLPSFYRSPANDARGRIVRERIAPARESARRAGLRTVYVTNYLSPGITEETEWRKMSLRTCGVDVLEAWAPPTPILEFASVIAPEPDEPVVSKQLYSGFFETHLDSLLRSLGARNLVVCGFETGICLGTTVTEAMYRNYRVVVLRDATHTTEYPETEAEGWANFLAIRFIESNVGYTATTADFIEACEHVSTSEGPAS